MRRREEAGAGAASEGFDVLLEKHQFFMLSFSETSPPTEYLASVSRGSEDF